MEVDETLIGGKARNMHKDVKARRITGTGGKDKTPVLGIVERNGKIRTSVIPNRKKGTLQGEVRKHVEAGSAKSTLTSFSPTMVLTLTTPTASWITP